MRSLKRAACVGVVLALGLGIARHRAVADTPPNFKIAFIGDQGLGSDAVAVLQLIHDEGADAVIHSGDFDYEDDPMAWEVQINAVLGQAFPYFACVGNHDDDDFCGPDGYQELLESRMQRAGAEWGGSLGARSWLRYQGICIVLTSPDVYDCGDGCHADYIRDVFAADDSTWRISSWHKNMRLMQVGNKTNATGWGVYEESRRAGAIIATAHEHSYSRTHLLSDCSTQAVAGTGNTLVLQRDDPESTADEGRSFVFVSGLGGSSIRDQELGGPWWASIYTSDQGANYGALFGTFHYEGDPCRAHFYFKDIDGVVADEFFIESTMGACGAAQAVGPGPPAIEGWPCAPMIDCYADVDGDGVVAFSDALAIVIAFGPCLPGPCPEDVDGDGEAAFADVLEVIVNWGPCS